MEKDLTIELVRTKDVINIALVIVTSAFEIKGNPFTEKEIETLISETFKKLQKFYENDEKDA